MAHQQQPALPDPTLGSVAASGSTGFQYMNSPFGDTTFTKVFVGGLAWETQSETMGRHFEQFGEILEAVVITDKISGRSKGYGFELLVIKHDLVLRWCSCADPSPMIDGRRANCNLASLGRARSLIPSGRFRSTSSFLGGIPSARGAYVGSFGYQQPTTYGFQQGLMYSPYGSVSYSVNHFMFPEDFGLLWYQHAPIYIQTVPLID